MIVNQNYDTYLLDFLSITQLWKYLILSKASYNIFKNSKYYTESILIKDKKHVIENFCQYDCINLFEKYLRDCTTINYCYLLQLSSKHGNLKNIILLARKGINILNQDIISDASNCGHLKIVKFLYFQNTKIVEDRAFDILYYLEKDYLDIISFLSLHIVYIPNKIFHNAISNGYLNIVRFLISRDLRYEMDINVNIKYACLHGHINIIKFLAFQVMNFTGDNDDIIQCTVIYGNLNIIKYILSIGIKSIKSQSSLIIVVENGYLEILRILICESYKCLDHINKWAARNGRIAIVKFLFYYGVDLALDINDAIQWASGKNHLNVVKFLFSRVSFTLKNNESCRYAIKFGHLEVIKFLISQKVNYEVDNCIIRKIVAYNNLKIMKFLVFHNCKLDIRDVYLNICSEMMEFLIYQNLLHDQH